MPVQLEIKNGQKRPKDTTLVGKIWAVMDKMYADNNNVAPKRRELIKHCLELGINKVTAANHYMLWKTFMGLTRKQLKKEEVVGE